MGLPNLRRIFAQFRSEEEESVYSRTAFFNFIGYVSSCVLFSLVAQRFSGFKPRLPSS